MKKPYQCFSKHVKTYKRHYVMGLFWSFALVKMIVLLVGFFWTLYHTQYHASAAGPAYINPSSCLTQTQIPSPQCEALVAIYNDMGGQNWINNFGRWNFSNINNRHGVDIIWGNVRSLLLRANNLVGDIPSNISYLTNIEEIHMEYNQITNIPDEIENLQSTLLRLYINNNQLTKLPTTINKLKELRILDASYNQLPTTSFSLLFPLNKIQSINFEHNLVDKVETEYWALADTLQYLNLSYNYITDISAITETQSDVLNNLYLRHNQIENIPENIAGTLIALTTLDLGKNLLDDKDLANIPKIKPLTYLYLDHNLIPKIPDSFEAFAKNKTLRVLDMSYNMLSETPILPEIRSLQELYLANNQIGKMIPLDNLQELQILDFWFNKLEWEIDPIISELIKISHTLQQFSFRHNILRKKIPKEIINLDHIGIGKCQLDYNWLDVQYHEFNDPGVINYLNKYCFNDNYTEEYLNTEWEKQYTPIETKVWITLDTAGTIRWWDEIEVTLHMDNAWNKNTDILDLFIYDDPTIFSIEDPTDGYAMKENTTFDGNDPCRENLENNNLGIYFDVLTTRAGNNWWPTFLEYLYSSYRDYDLYALGSFDPYPNSRGKVFLKWIDQYTYDAFDQTFQWWLFSWLFDIDLNDLAIQWCGIDWKDVTMYDHAALNEWDTRNITYTLKIADGFEWDFDVRVWLKSDNRLFQEGNTTDNLYTLTISVKWPLVDTDGDTIYDENDNCPFVENLWQEDENTDGTGDACDCNDTICTTWNDYTGNLICNPVDPACPIPPSCGNNIIEWTESCDGNNLNSETCETQGFDWGTLSCSPSCTFDTTSCITNVPAPICGNAIIEVGESCDTSNLNWQTCSNFGYSLWSLSCTDSCTLNTSNCYNPSWWWGGWGWGWSITPDDCPDGDYSPSYYDHECGTPPTTPPTVTPPTTPSTTHPAPTIPTWTTKTPLTRKVLAQLVSIAAKEILHLTPHTTMPCKFWDISTLSSSYQNAIILSCQYNLMGLHKDGIDVKIDFDPNKIVDYNEASTVISRLLYDGRFNPTLSSSTPRYQPHVTQVQKEWILPNWTEITEEVIINILTRVNNEPLLVQRTAWVHTAAPVTDTTTTATPQQWTSTVITAPATAVTSSIKALLENLNIFMKWTITPQEETNNENVHESAPEENVTNTSSEKKLLEDLSRFR